MVQKLTLAQRLVTYPRVPLLKQLEKAKVFYVYLKKSKVLLE